MIMPRDIKYIYLRALNTAFIQIEDKEYNTYLVKMSSRLHGIETIMLYPGKNVDDNTSYTHFYGKFNKGMAITSPKLWNKLNG